MGSKIVSCDDDMLTTHQTRKSLPFRGRSTVQDRLQRESVNDSLFRLEDTRE